MFCAAGVVQSCNPLMAVMAAMAATAAIVRYTRREMGGNPAARWGSGDISGCGQRAEQLPIVALESAQRARFWRQGAEPLQAQGARHRPPSGSGVRGAARCYPRLARRPGWRSPVRDPTADPTCEARGRSRRRCSAAPGPATTGCGRSAAPCSGENPVAGSPTS